MFPSQTPSILNALANGSIDHDVNSAERRFISMPSSDIPRDHVPREAPSTNSSDGYSPQDMPGAGSNSSETSGVHNAERNKTSGVHYTEERQGEEPGCPVGAQGLKPDIVFQHKHITKPLSLPQQRPGPAAPVRRTFIYLQLL
jgi:hypothetical protein